jgi:hypothetical protein
VVRSGGTAHGSKAGPRISCRRCCTAPQLEHSVRYDCGCWGSNMRLTARGDIPRSFQRLEGLEMVVRGPNPIKDSCILHTLSSKRQYGAKNKLFPGSQQPQFTCFLSVPESVLFFDRVRRTLLYRGQCDSCCSTMDLMLGSVPGPAPPGMYPCGRSWRLPLVHPAMSYMSEPPEHST